MEMKVERRKRGTGRVWKIGRFFWIQYYANGRAIRESSHSEDEAKAEKLLHKRLCEAAAGMNAPPKAERVTYENMRDAMLGEMKVNKNKSLTTRADGSLFLPGLAALDRFFAGTKAMRITRDRIREFILKRQDVGALSSTINRSLAALRRMFRLAQREGKLRDVPYFPLLAESPARKGFVEHEQYRRLRDASPDWFKPILAMAYFTGMRRGEILNLRWDNVNLKDAIVRLDPGTTKNNQPRTIPLSGELLEILKMHELERTSEFVFFRRGRRVDIRAAWEQACVRAGLGRLEPGPGRRKHYTGLVFHDLRRSGVRNMIRAGISTQVAKAISGHKTDSVFQRYNITSERDLRDAAKKLDAYTQAENGANFGANLSNEEKTHEAFSALKN